VLIDIVFKGGLLMKVSEKHWWGSLKGIKGEKPWWKKKYKYMKVIHNPFVKYYLMKGKFYNIRAI